MPALAKAPIIAAWRAIINRHPTSFTFGTAEVNAQSLDNLFGGFYFGQNAQSVVAPNQVTTYTGFLSDINSGIDLGFGGFTSRAEMQLFCLRGDFTSTVPAEEDIIRIAGVDYRIREVKKVFISASDVWGLVFALKGLDQP